MEGIFNEVLTGLVYPALAAASAAAVKFVLDWSKAKAREGISLATERAAGAIALRIGYNELLGGQGVLAAQEMADAAEKLISKNFAASLKRLGPVEPGTISGMVLGELGKLTAK